jgi:methylmalonyl-CoA mutase
LLAVVNEGTAVVFESGEAAPAVADAWLAAARRQEVSLDALQGSFGGDPLAALASTGHLTNSLDDALGELAELAVRSVAETPNLRSVLVSTTPYHDAGAGPVEELALALASGVACLRRLTDAGLDVDRAAGQLGFAFSVGRDLFGEIAKLRAARRLWSKVVTACGGSEEACRMWIHARTSAATATVYDAKMNLLRGSGQGFAAAVAGVDSLAVTPYDGLPGTADDRSRRLAINIQHILAEEAHLGRVLDPAGGSWYLESLTEQLGRAAWSRFQDWEREGGMEPCLLSGKITEHLKAVAARRQQAVAQREVVIVGVSAFANLAEESPQWPPASSATSNQSSPTTSSNPGATCPPLVPYRLATPFEELRAASDQWQAAGKSEPRAFLVPIGPLAEWSARAGFVRRLLAAGGIRSVEGPAGEDLTDAVVAFAASETTLAVICTANRRQPEVVPELVARLREHGAQQIGLAGDGGEHAAEYRAAGVDFFLYEGCDVLAILRSLLTGLGVIGE